ncbi:MAG: outer membrane protein [Alphaproteobacteria bacterium]
MMKKISYALTGATLLASVAMASDMKPVPALSPKCDFSGFYSGLTFGHASGHSNVKVDPVKFDFALKGMNGGVFLGFGKKLGINRFYLGIEAAYLRSGEKLETEFSLPPTASINTAFNTAVTNVAAANAVARTGAANAARTAAVAAANGIRAAAGGVITAAVNTAAANAANAARAGIPAPVQVPFPVLASGNAELSLKKKSSLEVAARMGIVMNNAMPYVKVGIVNSQFQLKGSVTPATHVVPMATSTINEKMRLNGLVVGAGIDLKVSRNMMMGLGYTYTTYKAFTKNADVQSIKPVSHNVMFRLGYAF